MSQQMRALAKVVARRLGELTDDILRSQDHREVMRLSRTQRRLRLIAAALLGSKKK